MMFVRVRLFAALRERAGSEELALELPDGAVVADALDRIAVVLGEQVPVVMAVNREYALPQTALHPDDELALIPPVSGGEVSGGEVSGGEVSGGEVLARSIHVRVTAEPMALEPLLTRVRDARAGAVVVFEGVTREVASLEYEAYAEMASEQLGAIAAEELERFGLCAVAVEHRVGTVPLSEPSVLVVASAPHRDAAFAGARAIIDRLKEQAPIWKKEEGEWVDGATPQAQG